MRAAWALLLLSLAPLTLPAAPPDGGERDLGQGLAYLRVHALPADLPATPAKPGALVLDLRYARGDAAAAAALGAWLQFRTTRHAPIFLLVNAATAPALLDYLETHPAFPGLVTLGTASSRFVPDLTLTITAGAERAAYDALAAGQPLASLLADLPDKPRHDEAAVAQEHAAPPADEDAADGDPADSSEPAPAVSAPAPTVPPRAIDRTLQRAVHLHRALLALGRL